MRSPKAVLAVLALMAMSPAFSDEDFVAATFAKAARYIYFPDFIHSPVADEFSQAELSVLSEQRAALISMVNHGFAIGESVGGALLVSHFELDADISLLRPKLFEPGRAYGWEGTDRDSEEAHLTDHQFVYHSKYLDAIEAASARPIYEAVPPTEVEIQALFRFMADPTGEHYYWAKWLARKLLLVPPSG